MRNSIVIIFFILVIGIIYTAFTKDFKRPSLPTNKKETQIEKTITIAAAGDVACASLTAKDECFQGETADLIVRKKPDLVLALGDLQYDSGIYTQFLSFYDKSWGKFKSITKPVPGNHEYQTKDAKGYFDYFNGIGVSSGIAAERSKGYYSFDSGDWHFIALNSNCWAVGGCGEGSEQYKWLQKDLKENSKGCTVAYWHNPVFSSGPHGSDAIMRTPWKLLQEHKTEIILTGHDHLYERFEKQDAFGNKDEVTGIQEFVVGTGGRNLYSTKQIQKNSVIREDYLYGVLFLTLNKDSYKWEFISIDEKVIDSGLGRCF
jgi:3',5'-cyclic AMP phosphodiesterase CpdA